MKPSLQTSRGRSLFFSYTSITQNFELRWQYLKITSSITSSFGDQSGWSKKWALCTLWPSISGWTARYQDNAPAPFFVSCPPSKSWRKKVGAVRKSWQRIKRRWRANIQLFNAAQNLGNLENLRRGRKLPLWSFHQSRQMTAESELLKHIMFS